MATMPGMPISGPLAAYVGGLWSYLRAQGYSQLTSKLLLYLASRLSSWLVDTRLRLRDLTRENIEVFFSERRQAGYTTHLTPRSLKPILQYLESEGSVALPKKWCRATQPISCWMSTNDSSSKNAGCKPRRPAIIVTTPTSSYLIGLTRIASSSTASAPTTSSRTFCTPLKRQS
jgi:hypothetical protein